jgi:glycosyltransferase involved in cell wall biosynthesis
MIPSLCLNMIVKNESKIITRLFDSVISIIDCYCICDTGSTDDTINVIQDYFKKKNIFGKIIQEPFINFSHNRNVSLRACEGMSDYILLLDADMTVKLNNFNKEFLLNYDHFHIFQGNDNFYYNNIRILKNKLSTYNYEYVGATHEYLSHNDDCNFTTIDKNIFFILDIGDGGCKHNKFQRDIELLTNSIKIEPNNCRNYFYLANSYYDIRNYNEAINYYKKRIDLKGWEQEVWYSYYKIGLSYMTLDNFSSALFYWLEGYDYFPNRIENIYEIIKYYRIHSKHKLAYHFYKLAEPRLHIKQNNSLFLHNDVYSYKLYFEYTIIAFYNGINNINNEIVGVLNNSNDNRMNDNLLRNLKFYNLSLVPINTINFNNSFICNNIHFTSSSSCLIKKNNSNNYFMNMRYVNYKISDDGSYIIDNGIKSKDNIDNKNIISLNKFVELDDNFNIIQEFFIQNELINPNNVDYINNNYKEDFAKKKYIGIEDVKIFNYQNKIFFIGTDYNYLFGKLGISYGIYDYDNKKELNIINLYQQFSNTICEKNWVFVILNNEMHIIYEWSPLVICTIEENNIKPIISKKMPNLFSHIRGSTCASIDPETSEKWFICHLVSYENPREYYHIFSVFDENMNLLKYSAPFKFENKSIEYCLSLLIQNNKILINYSTWDRTTQIGIYDKNYIETLLINA